ncbi:MAG: Dipeptidyl aminopeptidase BIII [Steroidobacteraceae bacterium]|nr:Dipeptidyl aminopeptidase BIII [Steroidobacteraceae bacterium]
MAVRWYPTIAGVLSMTMLSISAAAADPGALIARDALFGNPTRTQARLSPDGRHISYIAPRDGVLNVWVAPWGRLDEARAITQDTKRGIRQHFWSYDNAHVLYLQDQGGDENWRLHSVEVATGRDLDLTPIAGVQAQVVGVSPRRPGVVLVGLNDRKPEWHDLYEIDIASGKRTLVERNDQEFAGYLEDSMLVPRLAVKSGADGDEMLARGAQGAWESLLKYGPEDTQTTSPLVIEGDGRTALITSSVGRNTSALVRVDLATHAQTVLGASDRADVAGVWLEPASRKPQAYSVNYLTSAITPLVPEVGKDIDVLTKALGPQFDVTSRSLDDRRWIVVVDDPLTALASYVYERDSRTVTKLFDQRPALVGAPLAPMIPLEIRSRDGLTLVSYLTLPKGSDADGDGRPDKPLPLVLNVHGGPWARDAYGFDAEHQWLANRGYAVLSVNYRGSTGFGKAFINAGNLEWARRMHDDLIDAVDFAVREKITTADSVAIYGGSYGGYATLVGLTFTPDRFACGVDIVGPSNLATLLGSIPPYWKAFFEQLAQRVGDPRTEAGRKLLAERSPLTHVGAISKPLLIMQGANDPRVKQAESDQIVAAMKAKHLPVTYVLYPDEGHGFARPQNRTSAYAISEGFLAQCLGGRFEPVGDDFAGSSVQVPAGAAFVPGLEAALTESATAH